MHWDSEMNTCYAYMHWTCFSVHFNFSSAYNALERQNITMQFNHGQIFIFEFVCEYDISVCSGVEMETTLLDLYCIVVHVVLYLYCTVVLHNLWSWPEETI